MIDYLNTRLNVEELHGISALGLAHVGDAVYELMVRAWLCAHGTVTAKRLHKATVQYVSAAAQAAAAAGLAPELTSEEQAVFKRGRNSHVNSVPRGATYEQYHLATGLETLIGYLYLKGETARLNELFGLIINAEKAE